MEAERRVRSSATAIIARRLGGLGSHTRTIGNRIASAKEEAASRAVEAGAQAESVEVVEVEEVPLTYLPGNATRIRVKAVGELGRAATG